MDRHHLDRETQLRAVGMLQAGLSQRAVADALHTNKSVINRLWLRYQATGSVDERQTGRTRATNEIQDRFIRLQALRNRALTARQLSIQLHDTHQVLVSDQTIRNRLHESGLNARRPVRVPVLSRGNRASRLQWAQEHENWLRHDWAPILFTDESRFGLAPDSRRTRVWRRSGNAERLATAQEVHRQQGGTVMVWGGITLGGRTDLVYLDRFLNAVDYRDIILGPIVVPFAQQVGPQFQLMHDNARPHTARVVRTFLEENEIDVLPWPAQSPDLNPIEHLWDTLGRAILRQNVVFNTREQLFDCLSAEWNAIAQDQIDNLILSMPRRCRAVINNRGGHTLY